MEKLTKKNYLLHQPASRRLINQVESKKLWLCLCFPDLAIEIFTRDRTKEAVLITEKKIVVFLNQAARNLGLKPGISVAEALTINESVIFLRETKAER